MLKTVNYKNNNVYKISCTKYISHANKKINKEKPMYKHNKYITIREFFLHVLCCLLIFINDAFMYFISTV